MMILKNTGLRRIRLGRTLYIKPNEIFEVPSAEGKVVIRKHTDIVNITPKKPKRLIFKPKVKNMIKLNLEVKENDIE